MAGEEPSKVTTESSHKVLKEVAGRLEKIDAGELPTIRYVGGDGSGESVVSPTGEVQAVPASAAPIGESSAGVLRAESRFSDVLSGANDNQAAPANAVNSNEAWQPSIPKAEPRPGFLARLFAKLFKR